MAPQAKVEIGSAEIYFAKKLASNDVKLRNRSLKRLKIWLTSKSEAGLDEVELLKIWKGLFYCMWFSDKPLVQEELADNISQIIHLFTPPSSIGVLYYETFTTTIGREWLGIDRLRLDKFYMLIKKMLYETLEYLHKANWDLELISTLSSFLTKLMTDEQYPDGLKMYYTENILSTLENICAEEKILDEDIFMLFAEPLLSMTAYCKSDTVLRTVSDDYFDHLLDENPETTPPFKIPNEKLGDRLCELAADKKVTTKNRKLLYKYVDDFRKRAEELKTTEQTEQTKRKRKRKKKTTDEVVTKSDAGEHKGTEIAKKKKKKKSTQISFDENSNENEKIPITNTDTKEIDFEIEQEAINEVKASKKSKKSKSKPEVAQASESTDEKDGNKITIVKSKKKQSKKKKEGSVKKTSSTEQIIESTEVINPTSVEETSEESAQEDSVKLKLNFSDDTPLSFKHETKINTDDKDSEQKIVKSKKKKKKSMSEEDEPKPIKFVKTPPPQAFFNRALAKSEPPKRKKKARNQAVLSTPMSESSKKKVKIDVTKNMAVAHKDLKICPTPPFSPTRRPVRSAMKTRSKASDFF